MGGECISKGVAKNVSPFVYRDIFKNVTGMTKDFAIIKLVNSGHPSGNEVLVSVVNPTSRHFFSYTCGMGENKDNVLVLLEMDNDWYLVEMKELFQNPNDLYHVDVDTGQSCDNASDGNLGAVKFESIEEMLGIDK